MNKKTLLFLLMALLGKAQVHAQVQEGEPPQPTYIRSSIGLSVSNFRDLGTSPLVYSGTVPYFQLSHLREKQRRERALGFSYQAGSYQNNFNEQTSHAQVYTLSAYYGQLYQVDALSSSKWSTQAGCQLNVTFNYRDNPGLLNYSLGIEALPTVFVSAKSEYNFGHKTRKSLSYQFSAGLYNSVARASLPKLYDLVLTNNEDLVGALGYEAFSGFRSGSVLAYTAVLRNKNAIQLSYSWEAYTTGSSGNQFEMANHTLGFSLLFKTNNQ